MSEQKVHPSVAQRVIIKFLAKEGTKPSEILRRLHAQFGEATLSKTQVYDWQKTVLAGRDSVENERHQRRQRTSVTADNIHAVRDLIEEDRRVTISEIASHVGISFGSVQAIISDELKFRKLSARWVPRLTQEKLTQMHWTPLEHPPYSPDLSPCDYHLFGPLKEDLGGKRFDDNAAVEEFVRNWVTTRPPSFYKNGIKKLPN